MHVNADTAICEYYNNCKTLSFGKARETAVKQVLLTIKKIQKNKIFKIYKLISMSKKLRLLSYQLSNPLINQLSNQL